MSSLPIITGSYPDDVCGVGDYTRSLVSALENKGINISLFYKKDWSITRLPGYLRLIKETGAPVVNIQYPTEGYGYSILPQLLCCCLRKMSTVVTLHEFCRKSASGKSATFLFFLTADWIVFTTDKERDYACRFAPWLRKRSSVIPICSNIPMRPPECPETDVVYFGLIRPHKGLEQFASVMERLASRRTLITRVVGQIVSGYEKYAAEILDRLKSLGAEIILGRTPEEVSLLLSRARVALLPFPDGMSSRRGAALAAMGNGALLVTTTSADEPEMFKGICLMGATEEELAVATLRALECRDADESIRRAGQIFARDLSWSSVGSSYMAVINRLGVRL